MPYGLSLLPPSYCPTVAAGISEASRFSCRKFLGVFWGLRLPRTDRRLALSPPFLLPAAHYKNVGVRISSFRSSIAQPTYPPGLRFAVYLAVLNAKLGAEWIASPFS